MANFKYDIVALIELVESKPCIWDKTNENNKNKILRENSWQEIFQFLEDGYEELTHAEKKKTGEMIMSKWSNVRDAFLRSLRSKSGQGAKKKYIYNEHLQFLLKVAQKGETESNYSQSTLEGETEEECASQSLPTGSSNARVDIATSSSANTPSPVSPPTEQAQDNKKGTKSKRGLDLVEREILAELNKVRSSENESRPGPCAHPVRTDNETLLLSFVPYTRDMSEAELMELHMAILKNIKEIKEKRRYYSTTQPNFLQAHNSPSFAAPPMSHRTLAMTPTSPYSSPQGTSNSPSPCPSTATSIQMDDQQHEQHSETGPIRNYLGMHPYQDLFDSTAE